MNRIKNKSAFTLVEIITSLAIIGVFMAFFYSLYVLNWQACQQIIFGADMGQDMEEIVDQIGGDARNSQAINLVSPQEVVFTEPTGGSVTYTISVLDNGRNQISVTRVGVTDVLSQSLTAASTFSMDGSNIVVNMVMQESNLGQPVTLVSQTEFFPRNL
jgi:prepilin-type N-terminal cleavage/methylation domain-containing protein/uncharacterized repeat protein (TIGR01451 family)